jgi:hypothetical protein
MSRPGIEPGPPAPSSQELFEQLTTGITIRSLYSTNLIFIQFFPLFITLLHEDVMLFKLMVDDVRFVPCGYFIHILYSASCSGCVVWTGGASM